MQTMCLPQKRLGSLKAILKKNGYADLKVLQLLLISWHS